MNFLVFLSIILLLLAIIFYLLGKALGITWLKETLSSGDGTSSKRVTMFWFVVVILTSLHATYIFIALKTVSDTSTIISILALLREFRMLIYADLLFVLILSGIITSQNIIEGARIIKGGQSDAK